jgi:hypothetical protein
MVLLKEKRFEKLILRRKTILLKRSAISNLVEGGFSDFESGCFNLSPNG